MELELLCKNLPHLKPKTKKKQEKMQVHIFFVCFYFEMFVFV